MFKLQQPLAGLYMSTLLQKALSPSAICLELQADNKFDAISELLNFADTAYGLTDRAACERVVFAREHSLSTGMQDGIAMPHGKTDAVDRLMVVIGLKREGIEFECVDGKAATILIMTLSPASKAGPHIQFLAEISNLLRHAAAREQLLAATTAQEAYVILTTKKFA